MGRNEHRSEAPEQSPKVGALLTEARERKGLSIADVEQATKIRKRYLEGLEHDDYTVLPDAVYIQGFLKTYANYLDLDGEELSGRLKSWRKPRRERQINHAAPPQGSNFDGRLLSPGGLAGAEKQRISGTTILTIVIAVFVLAAVIGGLYYVGRGSLPTAEQGTPSEQETPSGAAEKNPEKAANSQDDSSKATQKDAEPAGEDNSSKDQPEQKKEVAQAPPDTLRVAVSVEDSAAWIQILSDGQVAFEGLGEPGYTQAFEAEREVSISTGNAGSVSVKVNGQDAGILGEPGEVLTRDFTRKASS
jgi:cytoskeletal protein RodZ